MSDAIAAWQRKDYATALGIWRSLADAGDAMAQARIGFLYANGEGVPRDAVKAVEWLSKAADQGNPGAEYRLGLYYLRGDGPLPKDQATGLSLLRKAADKNYAAADFSLGTVYSGGLPPDYPQDSEKAVFWWRKAADQGLAVAMYQLGKAYDDGRGIAKDDVQAAIWYRKAAEAGDPASQIALGRLYAEGRGVPRDQQQALLWLRRASGQGGTTGPVADRLIARLQGTPVPAPDGAPLAPGQTMNSMNPTIARTVRPIPDFLRAGAEQGDPASERAVGDFYSLQGWIGSAVDAEQAMAWWGKAAAHGDLRAHFNLAQAYQQGKFVPQDADQSVAWLRKAADKEYGLAESALGADYAEGFGVPKDKDRALYWFRRAAAHEPILSGFIQGQIAKLEQPPLSAPARAPADFENLRAQAIAGDPGAQTRLGLLYNDNDALKNDEEAASWLTKAARQGNADAMQALSNLYFAGEGVPKDMTQYAYWLKEAANHGRAESEIALSDLYAIGWFGFPKDMDQSVAWLQKAVDQGSAKGQFKLASLYLAGRGVPRDLVKAFDLAKKSADQHYCLSEYMMAARYRFGADGVADPVQYRAWLVKAADHPIEDGCQNLAVGELKALDTKTAPAPR